MSVQKKSTNSTARRTSKSSTSKKKSASSSKVKRTKKKKIVSKKHVKLDKGKVTLLTSIIFLVCCILLSVNILSMPEKKNRTDKNTSISKVENNSTLQNKNKKFDFWDFAILRQIALFLRKIYRGKKQDILKNR